MAARTVRFLVSLLALIMFAPAQAATVRAYVGSYTPRPAPPGQPPPRRPASSVDFAKGRGIYLLDFDTGTGAMSAPRLVAESVAVSWLVVDPARDMLYAANEWNGGPGGSGTVSAFRIDRATGGLTLLNIQPTGGTPVSLALHPSGRHLLAANYGGGSVAVLPIAADGSLEAASDIASAADSGAPVPPLSPNARHDDGPSAMHMVGTDHRGRFVFANDAVNDRVFVWRLDPVSSRLIANRPAWFDVTRGAFPRHFALSPDDRHFYNLGERDGLVTLSDLTVAGTEARLTQRQSIGTLPPDFRGTNMTSELLVSADGRFVYAANRGHNTIAAFRRASDGRLTHLGEVPTENDHPRTMALDPSGRFILALNQRGDSITAFRIDPRTGMPRYARQSVRAESPASIAFVP